MIRARHHLADEQSAADRYLRIAVTALAVLLLVRAGIGVHPDKIMISSIMLVFKPSS